MAEKDVKPHPSILELLALKECVEYVSLFADRLRGRPIYLKIVATSSHLRVSVLLC